MRKQVKQISVRQTSKVIATMYTAITTILVFLPLIVHQLLLAHFSEAILLLFIAPFAYWLVLYVSHVIGFWFYNLVAKRVGGVEFDLVDLEQDVTPLSPIPTDHLDRM